MIVTAMRGRELTMWVEITEDDKIIYHLEAGEALESTDMIDCVVIHAEECKDQSGIIYTLTTIPNMRIRVELETCISFNKLTPIIKKYIDSYYNVNTNECKEKSEVWNDVLSE